MTKEGRSIKEVNSLIYKELIKRGYSLEGNTRIWDVADSKLWYLKPDQAQAYLDELDNREKMHDSATTQELELIDEHIESIVKEVGGEPLNIVDLGCGDGRKAIRFLEEFNKKTKLRYCPVDISSYMVQKAIKKIEALNEADEIVQFQWNISDFDNLENISTLLRNSEYKKHLFLLLGNTLSNFEFHELLYQIRSSMSTGDHIIIGNGIESKNMQEYMVNSVGKSKGNNEFLLKIPLQLGLRRDELEPGVRIRNNRVEFYYTMLKDHTIKFGNKETDLFKGDQLIVAHSYYYPKDEFISFLNLYFDSVKVKASKDGSYALALCKK